MDLNSGWKGGRRGEVKKKKKKKKKKKRERNTISWG